MFTNFLTSTTSRYTSLRRTLLSSSSEDDSSVDDPESSHVSRVLRAYYTEKGRPFPAWLGTDPRAVAQAQQPQQSFAGSAQSSLRGQSFSSTGNVGTTGGGGLGDLWADPPSGGKQLEEPGSLRRGFRPRPGMRGDMQSQSQSGEELNVRQLPSQRAGSYQTQGQGAAQSQQQLPGRNLRPTPSNTASSGSVQERLKARLGNRSSGTPSPPLTGYDRTGTPTSNANESGYDEGESTGRRGYGGGQGSSRGNDGYDWGGNWGGGGQGNNGGGGRIRNESGYGSGGQRPR